MSQCVAALARRILGTQEVDDSEAFCFVVCDNTASLGMMRKLGLEEASTTAHWLGFERQADGTHTGSSRL